MNRHQRRRAAAANGGRPPSAGELASADTVARYAQAAYLQALERAAVRRQRAAVTEHWPTIPVAIAVVELDALLELIDNPPRRGLFRRAAPVPPVLSALLLELRQARSATSAGRDRMRDDEAGS